MLYIHFPSWLKPEIIPGLPIRWYGLMYIVAFAVAYFFYKRQVRERRFPLSDDELASLFLWGILGLILGARVFATLVYETSSLYRREPWLIFWPFRGGRFTGLQGMSYHGGVIGCITAVIFWCAIRKRAVRDVSDMFVCSIPLGYTFGRLGNFANGELYGRITESPAGMLFPGAEPVSAKLPWVARIAGHTGIPLPDAGSLPAFVNLPRHPSQLYEAFFEGIFLWAILWLLRKKSPFRGFSTGLYVAGYGLTRFVIEYFRQPDSDLGYRIQFVPNREPLAYIHPLTSISTGQVLSFVMILAGILVWVICAGKKDRAFCYEPSGAPDESAVCPSETAAAKTSRNTRRNRRRRLRS